MLHIVVLIFKTADKCCMFHPLKRLTSSTEILRPKQHVSKILLNPFQAFCHYSGYTRTHTQTKNIFHYPLVKGYRSIIQLQNQGTPLHTTSRANPTNSCFMFVKHLHITIWRGATLFSKIHFRLIQYYQNYYNLTN